MATKSRRAPRKTPAQKRSKETVRAIVTAAAHILARDGYEGANVNHIAEHAGVSIGSLYQYFPNKEALAAAVAKDLADRMMLVFQEGLHELPFLPLEDAVRGIVRNSVRAFAIDATLRQVIMNELPSTVFDTSELDAWLVDALRIYFELNRARIRPTNLDLAVAILRAAVEAAARVSAARDEPEEEVVEELSRLVHGYLVG